MFQHLGPRLRAGGRVLLGAAALTLGASLSWANGPVRASTGAGSDYSLSWHVVSAGGNRLRNRCFVLDGSVAQVAPGYSSNDMSKLRAGFLAAAPSRARQDQLFFDAFEDCTP